MFHVDKVVPITAIGAATTTIEVAVAKTSTTLVRLCQYNIDSYAMGTATLLVTVADSLSLCRHLSLCRPLINVHYPLPLLVSRLHNNHPHFLVVIF